MATPADFILGIGRVKQNIPQIKNAIQQFLAEPIQSLQKVAPKLQPTTPRSFLQQPTPSVAKPREAVSFMKPPASGLQLRKIKLPKLPKAETVKLGETPVSFADFSKTVETAKQQAAVPFKAALKLPVLKEIPKVFRESAETADLIADKAQQFFEEIKPAKQAMQIGFEEPADILPQPKRLLRGALNIVEGVITIPIKSYAEANRQFSEGHISRGILNTFMTAASVHPAYRVPFAVFNGLINTDTLSEPFEKGTKYWHGIGNKIADVTHVGKMVDVLPIPDFAKRELKDIGAIFWEFIPYIAAHRVMSEATTKRSTLGEVLKEVDPKEVPNLLKLDPSLRVRIQREWYKNYKNAIDDLLMNFRNDPINFIAERVPFAATAKEIGKQKTPKFKLKQPKKKTANDLNKELGELVPEGTTPTEMVKQLEAISASKKNPPKLRETAKSHAKKIIDVLKQIKESELKVSGISKIEPPSILDAIKSKKVKDEPKDVLVKKSGTIDVIMEKGEINSMSGSADPKIIKKQRQLREKADNLLKQGAVNPEIPAKAQKGKNKKALNESIKAGKPSSELMDTIQASEMKAQKGKNKKALNESIKAGKPSSKMKAQKGKNKKALTGSVDPKVVKEERLMDKEKALDIVRESDLPEGEKKRVIDSLSKVFDHEILSDETVAILLQNPETRMEVLKETLKSLKLAIKEAETVNHSRDIDAGYINRAKEFENMIVDQLEGRQQWAKDSATTNRIIQLAKDIIDIREPNAWLKYFGTVHSAYKQFQRYVGIKEGMYEDIDASTPRANERWKRIEQGDVSAMDIYVAGIELALRDLLKRIKRGKKVVAGLTEMDVLNILNGKTALPNGKLFTDYKKQFPNYKKVLSRFETERVRMLKDMKETGFKIDGLIKLDSWFPHHTIEEVGKMAIRLRGKKGMKEMPSFMKTASGSERLFNLDVTQVFLQTFKAAEYAMAINRWLNKTIEKYGARGRDGKLLRAVERQPDGSVNKHNDAPPGYREFIDDLLQFFRTEVLQRGTLEKALEEGLSLDDIFGSGITGASAVSPKTLLGVIKKQGVFLPEAIVKDLQAISKSSSLAWKTFAKTTSAFKLSAIMQKPFSYLFKNVVGDGLMAYAASRGYAMFPYNWAKMSSELWNYYTKGTVTPDIKMLLDIGGMEAGFISETYSNRYFDSPLMKEIRERYGEDTKTRITALGLKRLFSAAEIVSRAALAKTLGNGKITKESFREANYILVSYNRFNPLRRIVDSWFPFTVGWPLGTMQTILRLTGGKVLQSVAIEAGSPFYRDPTVARNIAQALQTTALLAAPNLLENYWDTEGASWTIKNPEKIVEGIMDKPYMEWTRIEMTAYLKWSRELGIKRWIPPNFIVATHSSGPRKGMPLIDDSGNAIVYMVDDPMSSFGLISDFNHDTQVYGLGNAFGRRVNPIIKAGYAVLSDGNNIEGYPILSPEREAAIRRALPFIDADEPGAIARTLTSGIGRGAYIAETFMPIVNTLFATGIRRKRLKGEIKTAKDLFFEARRFAVPSISISLSGIQDSVARSLAGEKEFEGQQREAQVRREIFKQSLNFKGKNVINELADTVMELFKVKGLLTQEQINRLKPFDPKLESKRVREALSVLDEKYELENRADVKIMILSEILKKFTPASERIYFGTSSLTKFNTLKTVLDDAISKKDVDKVAFDAAKKNMLEYFVQTGPTTVIHTSLESPEFLKHYDDVSKFLQTQPDTAPFINQILEEQAKRSVIGNKSLSQEDYIMLFDGLMEELSRWATGEKEPTAKDDPLSSLGDDTITKPLSALPGIRTSGSVSIKKVPLKKPVKRDTVSFLEGIGKQSQIRVPLDQVRITPTPIRQGQLPGVQDILRRIG